MKMIRKVMKMKDRVSIIIPVYNCSKFLNKCMESILNQDYTNIEVILVNDGSTDDSLKICEKIQEKDSRVVVINKENGGVSSARNEGLKNATGEYIFFVDGDDYIDLDCIRKCMEIIKEKNLDILKFSYVKELSKKIKRKYQYSVPVNKKIEKKDYKEELYPYVFTTNDFCNVTISIIKRNIIGNTKFKLNTLIGEDFLFFIECLNQSNNIYFVNDCFYHYIVNEESATHNFSKEKSVKKLSDSLFVNTEINEILLEKKYDSNEKYIYKCNDSIFNNLQVCIMNNNYNMYSKYIDDLNKNDYLQKKLNEIYQYLDKNVRKLLQKQKLEFYKIKTKTRIKTCIKKIVSKTK